jgi:hypothetical protein
MIEGGSIFPVARAKQKYPSSSSSHVFIIIANVMTSENLRECVAIDLSCLAVAFFFMDGGFLAHRLLLSCSLCFPLHWVL